MSLVSAKCPNCGATIAIPGERDKSFCSYCGSNIYVKEAVERHRIEVVGEVRVKGIPDLEEILSRAETYCKLGKYHEACVEYAEARKKYPQDWRAWWGEGKYFFMKKDGPDYFYTGYDSLATALRLAPDKESLTKEYTDYWKKVYYEWVEVPGNFDFEFYQKNTISHKQGILSEKRVVPLLAKGFDGNDICDQIMRKLNLIKGSGLTHKARFCNNRRRREEFVEALYLDKDKMSFVDARVSDSEFCENEWVPMSFPQHAIGRTLITYRSNTPQICWGSVDTYPYPDFNDVFVNLPME